MFWASQSARQGKESGIETRNIHGQWPHELWRGGRRGIVDLGKRLKHASVLDLLRAGALAEAERRRGAAPDIALKDVTLKPPVVCPEKILCIGVNYGNRHAEYKDGSEQAKYPSMFFRTPGSFVGSGEPLVKPRSRSSSTMRARSRSSSAGKGAASPRKSAHEHIAGYTLCNEGTAREWTRHSKFNVTQGKNFDASGSLGPWMVTADEIDPAKPLHLTTKVNGELRQDDTTANLLFTFADLIAYVTIFTTLKPGDIIVTGTPVGAGARFDPPRWLKAGDVVDISVPEIGTLSNRVVDEA